MLLQFYYVGGSILKIIAHQNPCLYIHACTKTNTHINEIRKQLTTLPFTLQINLARETLKGLLAHWLRKQKQRMGTPASANGELLSENDIGTRSLSHSRIEVDGSSENDTMVYPPFEFSIVSPPSIITEGTHGGPWRKKITDLDGTEDGKDIPGWCLDCVLSNRLPPRENSK